MASRPIQVDDAIDYLAHSQTDIASVQQFRKKLEQESGGPGRRYLGTLREWEVESLFDQFKTLKQGNACFSPAESHADHELLPDHINSTESLGAAGGRPFVIIPGPSNQQRQGARDDVFYIELMAAQHQAPGRNIVRSAKRNSQCAHSIIDRPTAAEFLGCTENVLGAVPEVRLRWRTRTYNGGQDKGAIQETRCRIEHVDGANVVFSGKDLSDQQLEERGEDDDDDEEGEEEEEQEDKTGQNDAEVLRIVGIMNLHSAQEMLAGQKRSSAARTHGDSHRSSKRAKR